MPGFDFSNHNRNLALHAQGVPLPKATSTGTTIVGCLYDGGVVIAADTRATSGPIVADKNCEKVRASRTSTCPRRTQSNHCRSTTSQITSDAAVQELQQTRNLLPRSSPRTWNCTHSLPAASLAS